MKPTIYNLTYWSNWVLILGVVVFLCALKNCTRLSLTTHFLFSPFLFFSGPELTPFVPKDIRIVKDDADGPDIVAPDFKKTFSAAMFAAPIKSEPPNGPQNGGPSSKSSGGGKGKKKKEKGMLLFATGGQRKY